MTCNTYVLITFVLAIIPSLCTGQTLDQVIQRAIAVNPGYRSNSYKVEQAKQQLKSSRADHWPGLDISAGLQRSETIPSIRGEATSRTFRASAELPIFRGFATEAGVEEAQAKLDKSEASTKVAELNLVRDVSFAFYDLVYAQEHLQLSRRIVSRRQGQEQFLRLRYKGGQEAHWTLSKAESDLLTAKLDVEIASNELESARYALAAFLGDFKETKKLTVVDSKQGEYTKRPTSFQPSTKALVNHPDIEPLRQDVLQAEAAIKKQKSQYWPSVNLYSEYGNQDDFEDTIMDSWTVGISAQFPLFAMERSANIQASKAYSVSQKLVLQESKNQLYATLISAHKAYLSSYSRYEAATVALDAANERASIVDEEYKAGLKTFLEWEQAQTQLIQAERNALVAKRNLAKNKVEWTRITAGQVK